MTDAEREELKQDIYDKIAELKTNIESLEKETKPVAPDNAIGRVLRMDAIHIKGIQESNLANCRKQLFQLEKILEIIDSPQFGMCGFCKKDIGFERIKAMPHTNKCIACAEKFGF